MIDFNCDFEIYSDEPGAIKRPIKRVRRERVFAAHKGWGKIIRRKTRKGGSFNAIILMLTSVVLFQGLNPGTVLAAPITPTNDATGFNESFSSYAWQADNPDFSNYTSYAIVDMTYQEDTNGLNTPGGENVTWSNPNRVVKVIFNTSTTDFLYATKGTDGRYFIKCPQYNTCYEYKIWLPHTYPDGSKANYNNAYNSKNSFSSVVADDSIQPGTYKNLYYAKNLVVTGTWDIASNWKQAEDGGESKKACSALDIVCKVNDLFTATTETMTSVGKSIMKGIASFFMPDKDRISKIMADMKDTLTSQLGFLAYPIVFLVDLLSVNPTGTCTINSCSVNYGHIFGADFNMNYAMAHNVLGDTTFNYMQTVLRAVLSLGIIMYSYKKITKLLEGNE